MHDAYSECRVRVLELAWMIERVFYYFQALSEVLLQLEVRYNCANKSCKRYLETANQEVERVSIKYLQSNHSYQEHLQEVYHEAIENIVMIRIFETVIIPKCL